MNRRLWHLVVGTRGGLKRAEIIERVRRRPYNAREISRLLGIDYKTARHHLAILVENQLLTKSDDTYGTLYFWSPAMQADADEWDAIWRTIVDGKRDGTRGDVDGEPTG